ncbi:MAG: hypothetical protein AAF616_08730 [Bacteroidota bacterium]
MKQFSPFFIALALVSMSCSITKKTARTHSYEGDAIGCGNFIVYKLSEDNREYLSIALNAKNIEFTDFQAFGVGKTDVMEVKRRVYDESISASLCNDVMFEKPELLKEESPSQGIIELIVSQEEREKAQNGQGYRVTLVLKKVLFEEVLVDYLRIEDVFVGWLPG